MAINKYQDYLNSIMMNQIPKTVEETVANEVIKNVTTTPQPTVVNTVSSLADLFPIAEETTPAINTDLGSQQMNNISSLFITGNAKTTAATALQMNGIDTLRHPDANGMHFGNPFSPNPKSRASVVVPSIKDSVDYFKRWLQGDPSLANVEPERRAWIVNQINNGSLKGKPLVYYTNEVPNGDPAGYNTKLYDAKLAPNHAHILLDMINNGITPYQSNEQLLSNLANSSKGKLLPYEGIWTRKQVAEDPNNYYVFGDNTEDRLSGYVPSQTQAVIRGLPNAIGIDTKHNRLRNTDSYFTDEYGSSPEYLEHLKTQQALIDKALSEGHNVYVPVKDGKLLIGAGKAELPIRAPKTYESLRNNFNSLFKNTNTPKDLGEAQFKVISGGQTGIDILGVDEAYKLGIPTGGTIGQYPNNKYLIEAQDDLIDRTKYGFKSIPVINPRDTYLARTEQNVMDSDGTIYFKDDQDSSGYIATNRYATRHNKPFLVNPSTPEEAYEWIKQNNIKTLNIAGNRGSKVSPEMHNEVQRLLYQLYLTVLNKK